ncbi:VanW family protein [Corynebacterium sp. P7003]|uniref:VanW family protein n=1 Tax=Corynebacterium pygosceleis TaxID=2800406 RepID=A0ABT3WTY3_9CORY|nr:VanW family protein [Corynebacterium pygosceleis]MCX7445646.1 VanW family protein [Corynebacterium pygosceleis]
MHSADSPATVPAADPSSGRRRPWVIVLGVLAGALVLFCAVYGADYLLSKGKVPRGVTVAGVDIGGMAPEDAGARLSGELDASLASPVTVTAGAADSVLDPVHAGLRPNWAATVAAAGEQPLDPVERFRGLFGEREVGIVSDVDDAALDAEIERLTAELMIPPTEGGVSLEAGEVRVTEPVSGQDVDPELLRERITTDWLNPDGVHATVTVTEPVIGEKEVSTVAGGPAAAAVSGPVVAHGIDGVDGVIPVERMGEVVQFRRDGDALRTDVDVDLARDILLENLAGTEVPVKNARISFTGGGRTVTPHSDGRTLDREALMDGLRERITGREPKEFDARYTDEPASFTTADAEKATFDETVSEFTTTGFSYASGVNIRRVAQMVDGAVVAPGQVFSLNGYTGPRGTAQGFVESGIILNGHADTAVGGGISQFATTLYNAAYFAGFDDVAHTPHSYYISRYPAGREATVFEGLIDLQFRNNSPYPVMINASTGDNSVTVTMTGVKTVNVESVPGGRWAETRPTRITLTDDNCVPSSGAPGFTTSDTRIIRDLNGSEIDRQSQTTVYDPSPIIRCG